MALAKFLLYYYEINFVVISLQVFTMEAAGNKHVVVSSYGVFKDLLIRNADATSNRNVTFRDKDTQEAHKVTPG